MRFLVDNALSPLIAKGLRDAGFEALHVRDIGMHSASDQVIFDYARKANLTIVTADTDFGTLLNTRRTARNLISIRHFTKQVSRNRKK